MKLSIEPAIKQQIREILAPLLNPELWAKMNLAFAKHPYAVVRMEGPTGCGKTALANYMARKMKQPPLHLDFSKVASASLGQTEKSIEDLFDKADETQTKTIIIEEADALVWSRDMVDEDTTYHFGFVTTLLRRMDGFINRQIPSLLIITSNHPDKIDSAVESRVSDVIRVDPPKGEHAEKVWATKLPTCIGTTIGDNHWKRLASLGATPRQMEQAVLKICRRAVLENREPNFSDFGI